MTLSFMRVEICTTSHMGRFLWWCPSIRLNMIKQPEGWYPMKGAWFISWEGVQIKRLFRDACLNTFVTTHRAPPKKNKTCYSQPLRIFSGHFRKLLKRCCSREWGARGLKRSTCYDSLPWNNRETTLKYVWSCFEKVFCFRLGFKYSNLHVFFKVPFMILLFGFFFPLKLGILVFMWGCWRHPTCHLWHQSFLQGLALRVGWMLEAIEGFGGCLVGWFPSFHCFHTDPLVGTNMFDLGKMNIIFKHACNLGDMLVPRKVHGEDFGMFTHQSRVVCPWKAGMIYFSDLGEDAKWNFNFH